MAASADLVVNIVTKLSGNGMADAEKQTSKFKSGLATASKVAGAALLGVGAAAISAANAAAEDAKSQALLANAMKNSAGANKDQIAQTEAYIDSASRATGVTDDELRPAMATLVRATGDVTKSQKLLSTAMDISAATGKPLSSVSAALAKGYAGNSGALGKLVPGISKAAIASGKFGRVLEEVRSKTKGAAEAAGNTAAGQMLRFKTALGETQEAAGAALLPVMMKLTGVLVKVGQWAQDHGTLFTIIAGSIAVMAAAVLALNLAVTIYTAVTTLAGSATLLAWGAALLPILLVVAAVAAVVAIVVILWKKSQTFRSIVLGVWGAIRTAAQATGRVMVSVWNAVSSGAKKMASIVRGVWQAIRTIASAVATAVKAVWRAVFAAITLYIRAYLAVVRLIFSTVKAVAGAAATWLRDRWQAMWSALSDLAAKFRDKVSDVWSAIEDGARKVAAPFAAIERAIQSVIDAVGRLITALGKIHVPKISLPHIPGVSSLARSVAAPAVEAVGRSVAPAVAAPRSSSGARIGQGVTVNVYGAIDPEGTARQVQRILSGHSRRVGLRVS